MGLPNFLLIGAAKSGTTTIHYVLERHPQIYMCPVKEVGFFWAYGQEVQFSGPGQEKLMNRLVTDLRRYEELFSEVTDEKAIGESSVRYLWHPRAPGNIKAFIPQARLIAILRQPADRAFSGFMHNVRDGLEPCNNFAEAIAQERLGERDEWAFCRYLDRGFYSAYLKNYLEAFGRDQMYIALFDDLKVKPELLMQDICRFLEVDELAPLDFTQKRNVSGIIRNPLLRFLWTHSNRIRASVRPLVGRKLSHRLSRWAMKDLEKVPFSKDLRAELTDYYREDILRLQDLIQRDLGLWLEPDVA